MEKFLYRFFTISWTAFCFALYMLITTSAHAGDGQRSGRINQLYWDDQTAALMDSLRLGKYSVTVAGMYNDSIILFRINKNDSTLLTSINTYQASINTNTSNIYGKVNTMQSTQSAMAGNTATIQSYLNTLNTYTANSNNVQYLQYNILSSGASFTVGNTQLVVGVIDATTKAKLTSAALTGATYYDIAFIDGDVPVGLANKQTGGQNPTHSITNATGNTIVVYYIGN